MHNNIYIYMYNIDSVPEILAGAGASGGDAGISKVEKFSVRKKSSTV